MESAGLVFAEHGFHPATVRQITDRAGVYLAAVIYHFRDQRRALCGGDAGLLRHRHGRGLFRNLQPYKLATRGIVLL